MQKITMTQDNLLTPEEFKEWLEQSNENISPLEEMRLLMREMITFEQKHKMRTEEFYARFRRGEMGDGMDVMEWAGVYELYLDAKAEVESQMNTTKGVLNVNKVLAQAA